MCSLKFGASISSSDLVYAWTYLFTPRGVGRGTVIAVIQGAITPITTLPPIKKHAGKAATTARAEI
ncbi:MAG: hypothetical protein GY820_07605 [Gammaproteobacteria bacterium]|nr:hypothetical protein [Gammaproteobacteria bacterium]